MTSASQQGKPSHQHSCRPADSCQVSSKWQRSCICVTSGNPESGPWLSPVAVCLVLLHSEQHHLGLRTGLQSGAHLTPCSCLQHGLPSHGSAAVAAASVVPAPWGPAQPAMASPSRGSSPKVRILCWPIVLARLLLAVRRAWWPASRPRASSGGGCCMQRPHLWAA